jgi:predicted amidohydrolase
VRVAVIQMNSRGNRLQNVQKALNLVDQAASQGAEFVLLPEYMTFLGGYENYKKAAESVPGETSEALAKKALQHKIVLHGGSLIEKSVDPNRFYNTSLIFDPSGRLIGTYRKIHLFDIDIPGQVNERESQVILPGDRLVLVKLPECKLGMSICFDLRFPEMYRQLAAAGAEMFVVPSAFAKTTGQVHWEILLRARAIENHAYVLAAGQYGKDDEGGEYYGHSMIIGPWGEIIAKSSEDEDCVLLADINFDEVRKRRNQLAVLQFRKPHIYQQQVHLLPEE